MTAFFLQQLLALYFAIIYNFQVVKSHYSGKNWSIYFKKFIDLDFFYTDVFFHFLLRKAYAESSQPLCWLEHNAFDQFWKSKFHFEYFPRNSIS